MVSTRIAVNNIVGRANAGESIGSLMRELHDNGNGPSMEGLGFELRRQSDQLNPGARRALFDHYNP